MALRRDAKITFHGSSRVVGLAEVCPRNVYQFDTNSIIFISYKIPFLLYLLKFQNY